MQIIRAQKNIPVIHCTVHYTYSISTSIIHDYYVDCTYTTYNTVIELL